MKKTFAMVLTVVLLLAMMAGCGNQAEAAGTEKGFYNYIIVSTNDSTGVSVSVATNTFFHDNGDGTYVLYQNNTMDITQASSGYLHEVGGATISYGTYTFAEADGESVYTLSKPTRVIKSTYMMSGPGSTIEVRVDSADRDTYINYNVADITALSEEEVIDTLLKTNVMGQVAEGDAPYITSVLVNPDTFMIEELY